MTPALRTFAAAAAAAYDPAATVFMQDDLGTLRMFRSEIEGVPAFTIEGTHNLKDWLLDLMAAPHLCFNHDVFGPVHSAFYFGVQNVAPKLCAYLASLGWPPYYIDGHSKGGTQGALLHAEMKALGHPPLASRLFEPARGGGIRLREYLATEDVLWTETRNVRGFDIVPELPPFYETLDPAQRVEILVPSSLNFVDRHLISTIEAALAGIPPDLGEGIKEDVSAR